MRSVPRAGTERGAHAGRLADTARPAASSTAPCRRNSQSVHLSSKTLARRLERLVRGRAVWYLPLLDFGRYRKAIVTRFVITLRPHSAVAEVAETVGRRVPGLSYVVDTTQVVESKGPVPSMLDVGAHVDSVGQAEDLQRELASLDSVEEVEILFPRRFYLYRGWFDEHVEVALAQARKTTFSSERNRHASASTRSDRK